MKYYPRCGENIPSDKECNCYFRDITNRINYELKYGTKTEKFTNEIKEIENLTEIEHESIID